MMYWAGVDVKEGVLGRNVLRAVLMRERRFEARMIYCE